MRLVRVGRSEICDIRLDDPTVSRRHAEVILCDDGALFVTDCASTSGSFVFTGNQWAPLRQSFVDHGGWLKFGNVEIAAADLQSWSAR